MSELSERRVREIAKKEACSETGCAVYVLLVIIIAMGWCSCHRYEMIDERLKKIEQNQSTK